MIIYYRTLYIKFRIMPSRFQHCSEVGIKKVAFALTEENIKKSLLRRQAYKRTKFIILRSGRSNAIVKIKKASYDRLFSAITKVDVLALPHEVRFVRSKIDVNNRSEIAEVALRSNKKAVIVQDNFEHINFAFREPVVSVRVFDVIPPPSRLFELAKEARKFIKEAVVLKGEFVDIRKFADNARTDEVLLPCHASGLKSNKKALLLFETPEINDATLIGCNLSRRIFKHIYGYEPEFVDVCPRKIMQAGSTPTPTLMRCCEVKDVESAGNTVIVPWGAELKHIVRALKMLVKKADAEGKVFLK